MKTTYSLICSALLLPAMAPAATLIHAGNVITAEGSQVLKNQTLVVEADKITAIEAGFRAPASGDLVVDLKITL